MFGSFWKDAHMTRRAQIGKGLLGIRYAQKEENNSSFPNVALEPWRAGSQRSVYVLFGRYGLSCPG